jgi:hypothetical protein
MRKLLVLALLPIVTSGCVRPIAHVATAPVRVTGKAVDWTTTSQSEADRNYGRKMRKQEAREGRERKKAAEACRRDPDNCPRYDGYRAGNDQ